MRETYIAGVGMTPIVSRTTTPAPVQGGQALTIALTDSGLDWGEVGVLVVGAIGTDMSAAPSVLHEMGWTGIPTYAVENASATGTAAFEQARFAVASGMVETAAVVGIGSLGALLMSRAAEEERPPDLISVSGMSVPAVPFALMKQARMHRYGESADASLLVVEKNLYNASRNPMAQRNKALTMDELKAAPMLVDPLRRVESCPIGDGAAAAIITSRKPSNGARAVRIAAAVAESDKWHKAGAFMPDLTVTRRTSSKAFAQSGITPEQLDIVEVHEAFSVEELQYIEDLGLAPEGKASVAMADGDFHIGGRVAVSPSGGLIGRGHPGGATGMSQFVEIVQQLRGQSGVRQQLGARIGFAHMIGAGGVNYAHIMVGED
ncbi:thiolase family protein [Rhodococcus sp. ARC_M6]|uniref:thiolase family protein n=1 Tax=Rhodococcus sp. ARC_M6 TaxID=2928852 RepID=UPI001FB50FA6|nr:thiolase family protein [Rhodococcus sp. ARC_M6]MCJ0902101.1 thiolase family protein [Rhodococcus sp. ARC_M6]